MDVGSTELQAQVTHLANLARNPGWLDYARARAKELEQVWPGIRAMIRAEIDSCAKIVDQPIDGSN